VGSTLSGNADNTIEIAVGSYPWNGGGNGGKLTLEMEKHEILTSIVVPASQEELAWQMDMLLLTIWSVLLA